MIQTAPLRLEDRESWEGLARGYKAFYETEHSEAEYERAWQRLLAGNELHCLCAHLDGRMVGIAHFLYHANVWTPEVCYLQDLFVDAQVRGKGAARTLIKAVAGAASERGAARLYWMTRSDNAIARALYDKVARHRGFLRYEYPL